MTESYDLIVVGAGPGGYVAAIRASQLGMKVAVVERRATLGGVCLNEGCIPSKALLDSSEQFALARDKFARHGIDIEPPRLNLATMLSRKDEVVKRLTDGVAYLFKKNKITLLTGSAFLMGTTDEGLQRVAISSEDSPVQLAAAQRVLLATGSEAVPVPDIPCDGELVVRAREALCFDRVPEHLVVVGGGFIGLELGSVWRRLGARVTVLEMLPNLLPSMDRQAADTLQRALKKQGIEFRLGTRVTGLQRQKNAAVVQFVTGEEHGELACDRLLVAVGRRPVVSGLGFDLLGGRFLENGRVAVDADYQTSLPGIYAVGDLIDGPMLAHKASEEGVACVERMAGKATVVD
jgi:dihydrolipoamide dehydrogenase